jgi:hypothetical protein
MKRRTRTASRSEAKPTEPRAQIGDSRAILRGIARILVNCGYSPAHLTEEMRDLCAALPAPESSFDPENLEFVAKLPDVLADWHEMPEYVEKGVPRLLPMRGGDNSLSTLIGAIFPERAPELVVQTLIRMRAIQRKGKLYKCRSRHLVFRGAEAYWRALVSLDAIVRTLEGNLTGRSTALEQSAISARLPTRDRSVIRKVAKERGLPALHGLDFEIRRRARKAAPDEPRTWAGVGMYVIDIPLRTSRDEMGLSRQKRASSRPKLRGGLGREPR